MYTYSYNLYLFTHINAEPPSLVNVSSFHFAKSGLTQLVRTANGGIPDSHNITLFKQITTSVGNKLQSYIGNSLFGEFTCIIESLYSTKQVSLFLQEKGNIILLSEQHQYNVMFTAHCCY